MRLKHIVYGMLLLLLLTGLALSPARARTNSDQAELIPSGDVTPFDLILAMNTLRVSNGLPALIEDPIIMAVAQNTAETMAAYQMSGHIGDVRGRIQAAGYGGGATVWATENFAVGYGGFGIDQIMLAWADAEHMRPATNPAYCHVGAGVADSGNGRTYFILQAAYTSANSCGDYVPPAGGGNPAPSNGGVSVPQLVIPVKIATPDSEGNIYHTVEFGQSFWSIAIAYKTTIADLEYWNNLSRDYSLPVGQKLFIPSSTTEGYATPTPVGLVVPSTPDSNGKVVHTVESYHTLTTISQAYKVPIDRIVSLNGIQIDWPLQIGQELLIDPGNVTPTPTPRPLTALQRLTPESDGNYYHAVQSGETLSGIAAYYEISLTELMTWNNLNPQSIIRPGDKLRLEYSPPTFTPTAVPPTREITATQPPPTMTATALRSPVAQKASAPPVESPGDGDAEPPLMIGIGLSFVGVIILLGIYARRKLSG